jgi:hypothetical protein
MNTIKKMLVSFLVVLMVGGFSIANAELVNNGNGLIYDTDLNVTFYDSPRVPMTWNQANAWAASLAITDVNGTVIKGWRLPTTPGTKQGAVKEGEMAHLYYTEWGNKYGYFISSGPFTNFNLTTPGVVLKVGEHFWTSLTLNTNAGVAWDYHMSWGFQHSDNKGCKFYAMAVHDGNVGGLTNAAPTVAATGAGVYQVSSPVMVGGQIHDRDGDQISYSWVINGSTVITSGTIPAPKAKVPYFLDQVPFNLSAGKYIITLKASDGVNKEVSSDVLIEMIDTVAPVLSPVPDKTVLWPPNNKMVPVTIIVNATDNSGKPVTVTASVEDNETHKNKELDWTEPVVKNGLVILDLRAEKLQEGDRIYTITITATDGSGNSSMTNVEIKVPHDQGK